MEQSKVRELQDVVIRFSGDSGDGMQLTGTLFSDTSALLGNGISTFPDSPAEIRAPQGTVAGVSGFQVHFGDHRELNPGDYCDVLVAMNPAALKANRGSSRARRSSSTAIRSPKNISRRRDSQPSIRWQNSSSTNTTSSFPTSPP